MRARLPDGEETYRLVQVLQLLADPVRLRTLCALDQVDELCVGDLARVLDATEDSVGYALRRLRAAEMVATRRSGRLIYYRLAELPHGTAAGLSATAPGTTQGTTAEGSM